MDHVILKMLMNTKSILNNKKVLTIKIFKGNKSLAKLPVAILITNEAELKSKSIEDATDKKLDLAFIFFII